MGQPRGLCAQHRNTDKLQEGLGTLPVVYDRLFPRHLDKALISLKYEFSPCPTSHPLELLGQSSHTHSPLLEVLTHLLWVKLPRVF